MEFLARGCRNVVGSAIGDLGDSPRPLHAWRNSTFNFRQPGIRHTRRRVISQRVFRFQLQGNRVIDLGEAPHFAQKIQFAADLPYKLGKIKRVKWNSRVSRGRGYERLLPMRRISQSLVSARGRGSVEIT